MRTVSIVCALAGCTTAAPPAPSNPAPVVSATAPAPAPAPTPTPIPPEPAEPAHAEIPTCRGDHFDIRDLAKARCTSNVARTETLPSAIALSVEPAELSVASGTTSDATLIAMNTSDTEVLLFLSDGCGDLDKVESAIEGAGGKRIDTSGDECGVGTLCGSSVVTVALAPGGTIRAPFTIDARKRTFDDHCAEKRAGKVAPGSYTLHVHALANLAELTVPIRVR